MCNDCHCNDDRDHDHDLAVAEAKGQFHSVTVKVTIETTVDLPGRDHTTEELEEAVIKALNYDGPSIVEIISDPLLT